jgi:hypothetical protein
MATRNWDGGNRANNPDVPFGQGYDAKTTDMQAHEGGANAWLSDTADNTHVKLTVIAVETDLSLAGSQGQSQMQRDFYPRNFQQPSYTITCQARSQQEVGRVAEFVHKAQRHAVSQGSLMGLVIPGGGMKRTAASADTKRDGMRGKRNGMSLSGFVKNAPRAHRRHDPAPTFALEFTVARSHAGIFQDQPYKVYKMASWSDIVGSVLEHNFIKPPKTIEQESAEEAIREVVEAVEWLGDLFDGK